MPTYERLFHNVDLEDFLEERRQQLITAIEEYNGERLLLEDEEELVWHFTLPSEIELLLPIKHEIKVGSQEKKWGEGLDFTLHVPFTGDPYLFRCRPSSRHIAIPQRAPKGAILANELILLYEGKEATPEQVRYHLERTLSLAEMYMGAVNMDLFDYNKNLDRVSRRKIQERRNRLMQAREAASLLGYPLREDGITNALSEFASSEEVPSEKTLRRTIAAEAVGWDVFICHASEDKEEIAEPLAGTLRSHGLRVWLDKFVLRLGDSIRRTIDRGLSSSRFGVVIISPNFFQKEWPQRELDGLAARELGTERVILPVWHRVDYEYVLRYSPILADRFAVMSSQGLDSIAREILQVVNANFEDA